MRYVVLSKVKVTITRESSKSVSVVWFSIELEWRTMLSDIAGGFSTSIKKYTHVHQIKIES